MLRKILMQLFKGTRSLLTGRFYRFINIFFKLFGLRIKDIFVYIDKLNSYIYIDTNSYHERGILVFGDFEIGTRQYIEKIVSTLNNKVVIDIGANIGVHTLNICKSRKNDNIAVLSIEANPEIFNKLEKNVAVNNCQNIFLVNAGVDNKKGEFELGLSYNNEDDGYYNAGIASSVQIGEAVRFVTVQSDSLDSILSNSVYGYSYEDVGLIKMDIEGMELQALHGMKKILSQSKPPIILEFNKNQADQIDSFLKKYNYNRMGSLLRTGIELTMETENLLYL
jgi:FkbM family methyltransferase